MVEAARGVGVVLEDDKLGKLDPNSIIIEECIDGTLIKAYFYNNKWNYSTNNCIDANDSYWYSEKSYYQLFKESTNIHTLEKNMDRNNCYSFIIKHPENSLIVEYTKSGIVQSYTRDMTTMKPVSHNLGLEVPQIYPISLNDIIQQNKNMATSIVGFLVTDNSGIKIKCLSDRFKSAKELINNNYDLVFICFDIYKNNKEDEFKKIFPQYTFFMEHIKRNYKYYINTIYSIYIKRFITKEEYPHKPEFNMFIRHIHSDYLKNKQKITKKYIDEKIKTYGTKYLYDIYCNDNKRS